MLNTVKPELLRACLHKEHPEWNMDMLNRQTVMYYRDIHPLLDQPLNFYLISGEKQDFRFGEFSILQIQTIHKGKSYFAALLLMNEYIKDRKLGKSLILRQW